MLAIIPARGGSERVPKKNLAVLGGRPLIQHTLEAAQASHAVTEILVSTDSEEIAASCEAMGITVPYRRPLELATDHSVTRDAVLDILAWRARSGDKIPDPIVLLQPTSPFRTAEDIDRAYQQFQEVGAESLVGIHPVAESPYNVVEEIDDKVRFLMDQPVQHMPRQQFPRDFYIINGAIYMFTRTFITTSQRFVVEGRTSVFEMGNLNGLDIDTPDDLAIAEALYQTRQSKGKNPRTRQSEGKNQSLEANAPLVCIIGGGPVAQRCLQLLHNLEEQGRCRIAGVKSTHQLKAFNAMVDKLADNLGVSRDVSPETLLRQEGLSVCFSIGNGWIIPDDLLGAPKNGIVNFHAGPLPAYKGAAVAAFAILNGESEFGVTFHKVDGVLDGGPIIETERFEINPFMTSGEVDAECITTGIKLLEANIGRWVDGNFEVRPQHGGPAPYRRNDLEPYRRLNPEWDSEKFWNHVRAFDWDGVLKPAFVETRDRRYYLTTQVRGEALR